METHRQPLRLHRSGQEELKRSKVANKRQEFRCVSQQQQAAENKISHFVVKKKPIEKLGAT
jgi:hypothetical protein